MAFILQKLLIPIIGYSNVSIPLFTIIKKVKNLQNK